MTCPECATKDREIARLRRDLAAAGRNLESAAHAVDVLTKAFLQAKEKKA